MEKKAGLTSSPPWLFLPVFAESVQRTEAGRQKSLYQLHA
jgi:hypothetical protein